MRAIRRFTVRTLLPAALADLDDLARNLRWSWHAPTRHLFASTDAARAAWADPGPIERAGSARYEV